MGPRTLFDKVWDRHVVLPESPKNPAMVYIDLHLVHEVTSPQAFSLLKERGLKVRAPQRTLATIDHSTPTLPANADGVRPYATAAAKAQVEQLTENCREFGITLHGWDSDYRGIVHVIGPELGATQPGKTIVCGDSHTSTHGAFGALAFGIGTTQVAHVLATQCILMRKPRTMAVTIDGALGTGVTAKDVTLAVIGRIGVDGGTGHVIEYRGSAIRGLTMEGRMTLCNMSIEAGARAGMVAPDETTFNYVAGRPMAPKGADWDRAVEAWRALPSDDGARFDTQVSLDAATMGPMVTYGTHPGMTVRVDEVVPEPAAASDRKALAYMQVDPGKPLIGKPVNMVFVGSCTNSRLSDLEAAADVLRGRRVHENVRMLVVPGSVAVKRDAEAKGLHEVFKAAGAEWREAGCSMCIAMNGDKGDPGQLVVSTSNRNFEGRQGQGVRTVLASPYTAAASAVAGHIDDPRKILEARHAA